ncbi:MAG: B12-binding domain-containing radical SAM protein [Acidobacteria bacterium RIFCSPLOWO2_12_FULL_67_14b]|nr:MAG: B12-binding domain-containing radical SAM protein [Acidobacteria bacterium RIFCSPLOWO2_12_FULL_67_14b]
MIVLFNPWSTPSPKRPLPMSLLALGSMLEGEFEYCIVDGNVEADPVARIVEIHLRAPLRAVAVTVMPGPQLRSAVWACRQIKRVLPGVPVIWGGYFPSQHADACLSESTVDVCVRGQGEQTMVELLRTMAKGGALSSIPGLAYRENGAVQRTAARALTPLDELPDWPYQRLPMARYFHSHYLGRRVATHHSSFGCPFACNFCAVVGMANRRWVSQSPARVGGVLERQHREYGADAVQFHDMDFFISEARTQAIADRLRPLGMAWWALGRVDELMRYKPATWEAMKASGLKMVFCGAESGSTDMLERMNKGGTASAELTIDLAARMKSYGVVPEFSFVVGNPPDPAADLAHTLAFIRRVKRVNPATEIILYVYSPVPLDGHFYDAAQSQGFAFPETLDGWVSDKWQAFALRRDPSTPWSHGDVRRRVRDFESVLNAYYPTVTDVRLTSGRRRLLRAAAAWRYHTESYTRPVELNLLQRAFRYQRPETTGF